MVKLPWSGGDEESGEADSPIDADPLVTCTFQDGTLFVYEDEVYIERSSRSKFSDKHIDASEISGVSYAERLVISYIQIEQIGFDHGEEALLTTPVDENTLHLGRSGRSCAKRARDAILGLIGAE